MGQGCSLVAQRHKDALFAQRLHISGELLLFPFNRAIAVLLQWFEPHNTPHFSSVGSNEMADHCSKPISIFRGSAAALSPFYGSDKR